MTKYLLTMNNSKWHARYHWFLYKELKYLSKFQIL